MGNFPTPWKADGCDVRDANGDLCFCAHGNDLADRVVAAMNAYDDYQAVREELADRAVEWCGDFYECDLCGERASERSAIHHKPTCPLHEREAK